MYIGGVMSICVFSKEQNYFSFLGVVALSFLMLFSTQGYSAELSSYLRPEAAPFPADNEPTPERVELGKMLFFDPRMPK